MTAADDERGRAMQAERDRRVMLDRLAAHSVMVLKVYGDEHAWVGDIKGGDPQRATVTVGVKNLRISGGLPGVLTVLRRLVAVVERSAAHPEDWELLLPRRYRKGL